jgi:hypothetical protein
MNYPKSGSQEYNDMKASFILDLVRINGLDSDYQQRMVADGLAKGFSYTQEDVNKALEDHKDRQAIRVFAVMRTHGPDADFVKKHSPRALERGFWAQADFDEAAEYFKGEQAKYMLDFIESFGPDSDTSKYYINVGLESGILTQEQIDHALRDWV